MEPSDDVELISDDKNEEYSLKIKSVVLSDEGRYRVEAKNDYGEATGEARLKTISKLSLPSSIIKHYTNFIVEIHYMNTNNTSTFYRGSRTIE